jgi:Rrf2 family iron-sulfur cluster assembly transcriptional regulator
MKLSTRSRYGTRMVLDLARRYDEGPVRIGDIAAREGISAKYLEQLIIPLKQAKFIKSVRGPKGGHMLTRPPERITVGEVVKVLERGTTLTECVEHPEKCEKYQNCMTRNIWKAASRAMYEKLDSMTFSGMLLEERHG